MWSAFTRTNEARASETEAMEANDESTGRERSYSMIPGSPTLAPSNRTSTDKSVSDTDQSQVPSRRQSLPDGHTCSCGPSLVHSDRCPHESSGGNTTPVRERPWSYPGQPSTPGTPDDHIERMPAVNLLRERIESINRPTDSEQSLSAHVDQDASPRKTVRFDDDENDCAVAEDGCVTGAADVDADPVQLPGLHDTDYHVNMVHEIVYDNEPFVRSTDRSRGQLFSLRPRPSLLDLLASWLDDLGEELMPDQGTRSAGDDGPNETVPESVDNSADEVIASSEIEVPDTTPNGNESPVLNLDSAIAMLERDMCKPEEASTPSRTPNKRRHKKTATARERNDDSVTPSPRINTNIPDVDLWDMPSPSAWTGSGRFHVIDRSYSPEPSKHEVDPFFSTSDPAQSDSVVVLYTALTIPYDGCEYSGSKTSCRPPELTFDDNPALLVMSARVPEHPLPQGFLAGLGDWSVSHPPEADARPSTVQHPPDLDPSYMQMDVAQDKFNEDFGNALEEAYIAMAVFSTARLLPGVPLSVHLRWGLNVLTPENRSLYFRKMWSLGLRGQYNIMITLGPLPFTLLPDGNDETTRVDSAVASSSTSASSSIAQSSPPSRPARQKAVTFGGVTAVSDQPPARRRSIQFGGVTAVSSRPPDPRKHAAAVATSLSTSTALQDRSA